MNSQIKLLNDRLNYLIGQAKIEPVAKITPTYDLFFSSKREPRKGLNWLEKLLWAEDDMEIPAAGIWTWGG